jgi:hypothetical protein
MMRRWREVGCVEGDVRYTYELCGKGMESLTGDVEGLGREEKGRAYLEREELPIYLTPESRANRNPTTPPYQCLVMIRCSCRCMRMPQVSFLFMPSRRPIISRASQPLK